MIMIIRLRIIIAVAIRIEEKQMVCSDDIDDTIKQRRREITGETRRRMIMR